MLFPTTRSPQRVHTETRTKKPTPEGAGFYLNFLNFLADHIRQQAKEPRALDCLGQFSLLLC